MMLIKTTAPIFVAYVLFVFHPQSSICGNVTYQLATSLINATKCDKHHDQSIPVIAFSVPMFIRAYALLNVLRGDSLNCVTSEVTSFEKFDVTKPRSWGFCVIGFCMKRKCRCHVGLSGTYCQNYGKQCWMVYCFLSCRYAPDAILTCYCDSRYYGKRVKTNDYWYNFQLSHTYRAPPRGWKNDPFFEQFPSHKLVAEVTIDLDKFPVGFATTATPLPEGKGTAKTETEESITYADTQTPLLEEKGTTDLGNLPGYDIDRPSINNDEGSENSAAEPEYENSDDYFGTESEYYAERSCFVSSSFYVVILLCSFALIYYI